MSRLLNSHVGLAHKDFSSERPQITSACKSIEIIVSNRSIGVIGAFLFSSFCVMIVYSGILIKRVSLIKQPNSGGSVLILANLFTAGPNVKTLFYGYAVWRRLDLKLKSVCDWRAGVARRCAYKCPIMRRIPARRGAHFSPTRLHYYYNIC